MKKNIPDTVIFDMDGLLINSEPLWGEALTEILQKVGIHFTKEMAGQTTGLRTREVVAYWYEQHPWPNESIEETEAAITTLVEEKFLQNGTLMDGVQYILDFFASRHFKIGIASSSSLQLINSILDFLQIRHFFSAIQSAEFEEYGKPHPAVYLSCAKTLGSAPLSCIAFEDSVNGLIAAKAARMKAVAVPETHKRNDPKFMIADIKLHSLRDFNESHLEALYLY